MPLIDKSALGQIRIKRLVLHEVGPKPTDELITGNELQAGALEAFLVSRIADASRGSTFTFREPSQGQDGSAVLASLLTITKDGKTFVDRGQALARAFHKVQDARTKRGLFALFEISVAEVQHFAILKFDHQVSAGYSADRDLHASSLAMIETSITNAPEAIQKAAVIRLGGNGGLLSVRERGVNRSRGTTDLFENYLGVVRKYSPTEQTRRLAEVIRDVAVTNQNLLPANFLTSLPGRIYHLLQALDSFDPDENTVVPTIFGALSEDSPIGRKFVELVAHDALLDGEHFEIDNTAIEAPTWTRIVTAEGTEINYNNDHEWRVDISDDRKSIKIATVEIIKHEQYSPKKTSRRS